MTTRHAVVDTSMSGTPIGELTLVASNDRLVGVYFPHHWTRPGLDTFGPRVDAADDALLGLTRDQLIAYLDGERTTFELPTAAAGEDFQRRVWELLEQIPYGQTTTYGQLAEQLGDKSLAQAVGHAVGHNPLSIIVPCHRVVGKDGKLTGYAGGLARKQFLLELEEPALVRAARLF